MKKIKKSMAALALSLAMGVTATGIPGEPVMEVHAEVTPGSSISLSDVSTVMADTADSVLRIYGDGSTVYDVPIHVTANCTVLLDNIENTADLTVETGVTANIVIRGNCSLGNVVAVGGVRTGVTISGEDGNGILATGNIAQAKAGQALASGYPSEPEMAASVEIEGCTVTCDNIGCGSDGFGWTYDQFQNGHEKSHASNAGSASNMVIIRNATVNARGSIACGGNGILKKGEDRWTASDGGRSGDVIIAQSHVTVGGNMSVGGAGGNGCVTGTNSTVSGGEAWEPGIVTITNNSVVEVTGNVATAADLPNESHLSDQDGLRGGIVNVSNSTLICKDIASGGRGIGKTYDSVSSSNTTYYGTDGGYGGELLAKGAVIQCKTACNGGEAGEYYEQTSGGEVSYERHPLDGGGGRITATNSHITITDTVCKRAMKWDGYGGNQSFHNKSSFIGGTLMGGEIFGGNIVTDLTAIDGCELIADFAVKNSEGAEASKCIINTSNEMAGETVFVTANTISGSAILNESGQLVTYVAMGTNDVKIRGTKTYAGTILVTGDPISNEFSLEEESTPGTPDDGGSSGSTGGGSGSTSGDASGGAAGGSSGGASGGTSGGSSGGASGGTTVEKPNENPAEKPGVTEGTVTDIRIRANQKGIRLIPTSGKNTYKRYYKTTVKLTVTKQHGCTYYYKVVEKGKTNSTKRWKKLSGNVIKVTASNTAKCIYIRAVGQNGVSVTRKTNGFYVDNRKPVVKGVKNKSVYTKPVKIRFSDNISVKAATLNGRKVKSGYKVSKKGTYKLIVSDRAGNKRTVRFTIKK